MEGFLQDVDYQRLCGKGLKFLLGSVSDPDWRATGNTMAVMLEPLVILHRYFMAA